MIKILDQTDYLATYSLLSSKKKVADYNYSALEYDSFVNKIEKSTTTTFFLKYENNILQAFLLTRKLNHVFPAWYAHLIVVQNNLPLRTSWHAQADLYDYAIEWYEQTCLTNMFFYLQPVRYEKCLNVPIRKYSTRLKTYKSVVIEKIEAETRSKSSLIDSMLNQTAPKVNTNVILKINENLYNIDLNQEM